MKLLTCMSIAGSIPVVICLLMYLIQHADYNYTLGRRLQMNLNYIYQVLCPSLQKDKVSIYGCHNGLMLYLRYGWQRLLFLPFIKSSASGEELIPFRIIYLIKWKIQTITKYII